MLCNMKVNLFRRKTEASPLSLTLHIKNTTLSTSSKNRQLWQEELMMKIEIVAINSLLYSLILLFINKNFLSMNT